MKSSNFVIATIFLILTAAGGHGQGAKRAAEFYANGLTASEANKYEEAVRLFRRALEKAPDSSVAWNRLGFSYSRLGKREEALDAYRKAAALASGSAIAHYNLGNALYLVEDLKGAEAELALSNRLQSGFVEALTDLGAIQIELGEFGRAGQNFELAIKSDPLSKTAQRGLGLALQKQGNTRQAIIQYLRVLAIDSNDAEMHNNLGVAYQTIGQCGLAAKSYLNAIGLKPDYAEAHYNSGILAVERHLSDLALDQYTILKKLDIARARELYKAMNAGRVVDVSGARSIQRNVP